MAISNWLENNLIDFMLRGQAFTPPATIYVGLFITAPNDAGGGTEVSGGSYARVGRACTLANFSGTQGAGTTDVSSGTSGTSSNNASITFPAPTANWGTVTHLAVFDASTGGNMLWYTTLASTKTINNGDSAPAFPVSNLTFTLD